MHSVVIVGGGISGLSTAWYLAKAGVRATLVEARPRLGGVIQTEVVDGCVIEGGPDSFLSIKPAAMELLRELGLESEVIGSNDHLRKTYVWKGGRLIALPDGLQLIVPTKILPLVTTRLLSWSTKIRMGLEMLHSPGARNGDQSVADFVEQHYGREAVDYLTEPLLSGIYGGSPQALSMQCVLPRFLELEQQYGSLTRGVLAERRKSRAQAGGLPLFRSLKGGLGQMIQALQEQLSGRMDMLHGTAETIQRSAGGFRLRVNGEWLETGTVVAACPAHAAADLVETLDGRAAELLRTVPYSSSMTVALGFPQGAFPRPLEGFGFLVPKRERKRLVACTWVGTKFPHRVPAGTALLRCFLGGMDDAGILQESDERVLAGVLEELQEIVGFAGRPLFSRISRWPASMAQYTVGHQARLAELNERMARLAHLRLVGNAYQGIGIPDCIRMGKQAAAEIAAAR